MSSIWIQCAGASRIAPLEAEPWRVVEAQHRISTRKLVDSDEEQQLLEELIEGTKPPERTRGSLHYLLFTPFRYPPLRHGSRFGRRSEAGIWYGSQAQRTAFAEVAYYRLLFLEGTEAELEPLHVQLTAFRATVRTARGIDLTARAFAAFQAELSSRTEYQATQELGSTMRAAGVQACRYRSARDVEAGDNIAVFAPAAFGRRLPKAFETWDCFAVRTCVEFMRRDYFKRGSFNFRRTAFLVNGALPAPAL